MKIPYKFSSKPWFHSGTGGWCFVSLPIELAKEIRENVGKNEEGWGRLKIIAKISTTEWKTSIWFDTKLNTYLLPLKAEVRKKEAILIYKDLEVTIWV